MLGYKKTLGRWRAERFTQIHKGGYWDPILFNTRTINNGWRFTVSSCTHLFTHTHTHTGLSAKSVNIINHHDN